MSTPQAMQINTIANRQRKTQARISLEQLYKRGTVGEFVIISEDDMMKGTRSRNTLINRVHALMYVIGKNSWGKATTIGDYVKVTKVSVERQRDRVKALRTKRKDETKDENGLLIAA